MSSEPPKSTPEAIIATVTSGPTIINPLVARRPGSRPTGGARATKVGAKTGTKSKPKAKPKTGTKTGTKAKPKTGASPATSATAAYNPATHPSSQQPHDCLNLTHRPLTIKAGEWYNLETSRRMTRMEGRTYLVWPRVTGNAASILEYLTINQIDSARIVYSPNSELQGQLCSLMMEKKPHIITVTDIDSVPDNELSQVYSFSFTNITVEARITRIIDGDTLDCAMFLDPSQLAWPTVKRDDRKTVVGQNCTLACRSGFVPHHQDSDYTGIRLLIKLRIRLFGVDAADKDIPRKDAATQFVEWWSHRLNGRIWMQLMGYDCRSRVLGNIFPRYPGRRLAPEAGSLTLDLVAYRHPNLGIVAKSYHGGNKSEAWGGVAEP